MDSMIGDVIAFEVFGSRWSWRLGVVQAIPAPRLREVVVYRKKWSPMPKTARIAVGRGGAQKSSGNIISSDEEEECDDEGALDATYVENGKGKLRTILTSSIIYNLGDEEDVVGDDGKSIHLDAQQQRDIETAIKHFANIGTNNSNNNGAASSASHAADANVAEDNNNNTMNGGDGNTVMPKFKLNLPQTVADADPGYIAIPLPTGRAQNIYDDEDDGMAPEEKIGVLKAALYEYEGQIKSLIEQVEHLRSCGHGGGGGGGGGSGSGSGSGGVVTFSGASAQQQQQQSGATQSTMTALRFGNTSNISGGGAGAGAGAASLMTSARASILKAGSGSYPLLTSRNTASLNGATPRKVRIATVGDTHADPASDMAVLGATMLGATSNDVEVLRAQLKTVTKQLSENRIKYERELQALRDKNAELTSVFEGWSAVAGTLMGSNNNPNNNNPSASGALSAIADLKYARDTLHTARQTYRKTARKSSAATDTSGEDQLNAAEAFLDLQQQMVAFIAQAEGQRTSRLAAKEGGNNSANSVGVGVGESTAAVTAGQQPLHVTAAAAPTARPKPLATHASNTTKDKDKDKDSNNSTNNNGSVGLKPAPKVPSKRPPPVPGAPARISGKLITNSPMSAGASGRSSAAASPDGAASAASATTSPPHPHNNAPSSSASVSSSTATSTTVATSAAATAQPSTCAKRVASSEPATEESSAHAVGAGNSVVAASTTTPTRPTGGVAVEAAAAPSPSAQTKTTTITSSTTLHVTTASSSSSARHSSDVAALKDAFTSSLTPSSATTAKAPTNTANATKTDAAGGGAAAAPTTTSATASSSSPSPPHLLISTTGGASNASAANDASPLAATGASSVGTDVASPTTPAASTSDGGAALDATTMCSATMRSKPKAKSKPKARPHSAIAGGGGGGAATAADSSGGDNHKDAELTTKADDAFVGYSSNSSFLANTNMMGSIIGGFGGSTNGGGGGILSEFAKACGYMQASQIESDVELARLRRENMENAKRITEMMTQLENMRKLRDKELETLRTQIERLDAAAERQRAASVAVIGSSSSCSKGGGGGESSSELSKQRSQSCYEKNHIPDAKALVKEDISNMPGDSPTRRLLVGGGAGNSPASPLSPPRGA